MPIRLLQYFRTAFLVLLLALTAWVTAPPGARAFDDPSLLPATQTPIIDLANFLPSLQEETLADELESFEAETGFKLRVLTQFDRTPGRAVKRYWDLGDRSVLLVADGRGGNLLAFNVGDELYDFLPRTFWVELQTRFGNLYFVRDNGENNAIVQALGTVESCLRQGGCQVVPGLPREQWILTLITSTVGGAIFGFAAQPRKDGRAFSWQWALIFSPLWGILFLAFGIGPVVTRTTDWLPLLRNVLGFAIGALVAFLSPTIQPSVGSEKS
ncbi:beta-propeller domains of methanol dehydrogenase type [Rubidibacter lacunae KORDI 51-2]|uniref:Beta-propeller domains of methanol dehydrogenase type n=1 Tax=Rubidibacter lacunae KORDI 51-2 TaxID=582515 RepID=U5DCV7_9CHRO|nr:TPM domain-containing protein [Rubidibacter lacunae]ERN42363.1 beta-propeller domains of methanol dehydrogenase type [Rubidibacter lacunae KORDI 51-2]